MVSISATGDGRRACRPLLGGDGGRDVDGYFAQYVVGDELTGGLTVQPKHADQEFDVAGHLDPGQLRRKLQPVQVGEEAAKYGDAIFHPR